MIFGQSEYLIITTGIWLEYALTKGLNPLIIVLMQTVVDERASSFCVVLINMLEQITTLVIAPILAAIAEAEGGNVRGETFFQLSFFPYLICFLFTIIITVHIRNMFRERR